MRLWKVCRGLRAGHAPQQQQPGTRETLPSPAALTTRAKRVGQARLSHIGRTRKFVARPAWLPLLWGEGWGEGERGRRTDAAAQYVCSTRETKPQLLAALAKNVGAPPDSQQLANAPGEGANRLTRHAPATRCRKYDGSTLA